MMLDDFRNTKSLPWLRVWSAAVMAAIGSGANTLALITAHCERLVAAGKLPHPQSMQSELRQTLKRMSDRSRISYSRSTGVWRVTT